MSKAIGAHLRSNVVGYVALFAALTAPAWADEVLPHNSVGTEQIRNREVRSADVGLNQVRSPHIARQTIQSADIARLERLALAQGATIAFGNPGATLRGDGTDQLHMDGQLFVLGAINSGLGPSSVRISPDGEVRISGDPDGGRLTLAGPAGESPASFGAATIFTRDNGTGKTELVVEFATGESVLATQP